MAMDEVIKAWNRRVDMSKFSYDVFKVYGDNYYSVAVSKERYSEQEAIQIAKSELGVKEVEKRDGFVRFGYGLDDDNELRNTWWLEWSESKRCCPVWAFRRKED